jgi:apolipoprotein N-acyltransferase
MQLFHVDFARLSNPYNRIVVTFGNPNFSSAAFGLFGVAMLFLAISNHPNQRKQYASPLLWVLSLTLAFLSWATESLQGLLIYLLGSWLVFLRVRISRAKSLTKILSLVFTACSLFFALYSLLGLGPIGQIVEQYTLKLRLTYASYGLHSIATHPLTGLGSDEYLQAFLNMIGRRQITHILSL